MPTINGRACVANGRNLLTGTQDWQGNWGNLSRWAVDDEKYKGLTVRKFSASWWSLGQYYNAKPNTTYTFSFYAKASEAGNNMCIFVLDSDNWSSPVVSVPVYADRTITTEWQRYSVTFTTKSGGTIYPSVCSNKDDITIYVAGYKLEKGSVATPWAPVPVDKVFSNGKQVYGRNLLTGTKDWQGEWSGLGRWSVDAEAYKGLVVRRHSESWFSAGQYYDAKPNTTYTFSCYVKASEAGNNMCIFVLDSDNWSSPVVSVPDYGRVTTTEWQRYSVTFTTKNGGKIFPNACSSKDDITIYVAGYKLEKGSVATPWTPAPEDVGVK